MRVTVDGKSLVSALQWGSKGFNKALGENASGYVVTLHVEGSMLSVYSYDTAHYFKAEAPVSGAAHDQSINVRVDGPNIQNVAKVIGNEPVTVDFGESEVTFIISDGQYAVPVSRVRGSKPNSLPPVVGTIPLEDLKNAANHCTAVAPTDFIVPQIASVLIEFHPEDKYLRFEATDRIIMTVRDIDYVPANDVDENLKHVLVPPASLKSLVSALPTSSDVEIRANEDYFGISGNGFEGYIVPRGGEPVNYKPMLEKKMVNKFTFEISDMKSAIAKVSAMSSAKSITLSIEDGQATVTSFEKKATKKLPIVMVENDAPVGEEFRYDIKMNPDMFGKALAQVDTSVCEFSFTETNRNVVLRETAPNGEPYDSSFNTVMALR